jgi:hypothetical protein
MSNIPTTEHRNGELTGPRSAKCTVTINRREGVVTVTINDVEPRAPPDGHYTLTVKGEPTSKWKRDRYGWERLS